MYAFCAFLRDFGGGGSNELSLLELSDSASLRSLFFVVFFLADLVELFEDFLAMFVLATLVVFIAVTSSCSLSEPVAGPELSSFSDAIL